MDDASPLPPTVQNEVKVQLSTIAFNHLFMASNNKTKPKNIFKFHKPSCLPSSYIKPEVGLC